MTTVTFKIVLNEAFYREYSEQASAASLKKELRKELKDSLDEELRTINYSGLLELVLSRSLMPKKLVLRHE